MEIKPIAYIETDFREKFGIPRQSGRVPSLLGRIVFLPEFRSREALRGIEDFSHVWLLFDFSASHRESWSPTVRPPRLGGNRRMGVFATRSPFRPNPIGLSCVKLLSVEKTEKDGEVLLVSGVDLLDKTPIFDIKPYLPGADCYPDASGSFSDTVQNYYLSVECPPHLLDKIPSEKKETVLACIAEDPRPSYQADPDRIYRMQFASLDIAFTVSGKTAHIVSVEKL